MAKTDNRKGKKKKKRGAPVARPLSPTRLTELKALKSFPDVQQDFDPRNDFKHDYDLWITYGYSHHGGNRVIGGLKLTKANPTAGKFKLDVVQSYSNAENVLHMLTATTTCNHDHLALPQEWQLTSKFSQTQDTWKGINKELTSECEIDGAMLRIRTNGKMSTRKLNGPTTSDWSLFEAVQRMPSDNSFKAEFDLLEGLSALRPAHRITYKGNVEHQWGEDKVQLHYFRQFGQGMLPYEYYLDDTHRLVMVISGYRAYILKGGNA